jgi:hypothetical protein
MNFKFTNLLGIIYLTRVAAICRTIIEESSFAIFFTSFLNPCNFKYPFGSDDFNNITLIAFSKLTRTNGRGCDSFPAKVAIKFESAPKALLILSDSESIFCIDSKSLSRSVDLTLINTSFKTKIFCFPSKNCSVTALSCSENSRLDVRRWLSWRFTSKLMLELHLE